MQRIYLPHTQFSQTLCISEKELYHQVTRVMRARVWQHYIFFDGKTLQDFVYEISEIDAKKVVFLQKEVTVKNTEISPELYLFQALPNKLEKLEYIIQKSCEVGYRSITFFEAERSQILVLSENKKERLNKIAIEAIEQCGGNIIPEIEFISSLTLESKGDALSLFCHTSSENATKLFELSFRDLTQVNIYVGPEGGFSQSETNLFHLQWIQAVHFGERILRTETVAPLIGFSLTQKKEA